MTITSRDRRRGRPLAAALVCVVVLATTLAGCGLRSRHDGADPVSTATTTPAASSAGIAPGVDAVGDLVAGELKTADGRTRSYHLYVPTTLPTDHPVPLLVGLHGGGGTGTQFAENSAFDRLAEANGFLVVYPDGIGLSLVGEDDHLRTWNAGGCCGTAVKEDIDDVAFVSQLIDAVEQQHQVDSARVYAAGHSNGAMLSYRLACELSDKIVAVGIVSGALEVPTCTPSQPVSVIQINGTADDNVPIKGGTGSKTIGTDSHPPPREGADRMAVADACTSDPTADTQGDITTTTWSSCAAGTAIRYVVIEGSPHAWPGSTAGRHDALVGVPYAGYDATAEVWAFLTAHPRST